MTGTPSPELDEALRALAEPRRRAILRLVAHEELPAGAIAAAFDVSRTAVSQHLTVLKNAGLLEERRDGTRRLYRARPQGLAELRDFLDDMWASALDRARRLVEGDQVEGDRVGDHRVAEHRIAGDRVASHRLAGDRVAGDRVAGHRREDRRAG